MLSESRIDHVSGTGWSSIDWIRNTNPGTVHVNLCNGGSILSDNAVNEIYDGTIAGAINVDISGNGTFSFSSAGNDGQIVGPLMSTSGNIVPLVNNTNKLGNTIRRWSEVNPIQLLPIRQETYKHRRYLD